ncbi:MAG: biotin attachment protein [Chloroflexi bacterium]|nr:biotin attachment protein [Chloroflexota bacterium]
MSLRRYTVSIDDHAFTVDVLETAADRFEVSVDGRTFEATLLDDHDLPGAPISPQVAASEPRAIGAATGAGPAGAAVGGGTARRAAATPSDAPAPAHRPAAVPVQPGGRVDALSAPLPGVVLEVFVAVGASVRRGDAVLVLEAMKMRNTIRSPRDAVIVEVGVAAGQPVGPGALLVRLGDAPG